MTIVNQQKTEHSHRTSITVLGVLTICTIVLGLFWYNQIVNLTHELASRRQDIQKIQAQNAELKQRVYALLSFENLQKVANAHNLVAEKNPQYLGYVQELSFVTTR